MVRARLVALLALASLGAGCAERGSGEADASGEAGAAGIARWSLSEPLVQVGTVEGEEAYQLHDVTDALLLADGRLAVANQGSREVRVYDREGLIVARSGEDGAGPGQWRLIADLEALGGDSLLETDPLLGRQGIVDAALGTYLGSLDEGVAAARLSARRHHDGLLLETAARSGGPDALAAVVARLDPGGPAAPVWVRLDGRGRVLVQGAASADVDEVRVHRATLVLPPRFRPTSIERDVVVGVWQDSLDVQHVQVRRIDRDGGPVLDLPARPALVTPLVSARVEPADLPALRDAFRSVAVAQEIHYSMTGSYAGDAAALAGASALELPGGARLDLLDAGPRGWWGRLVDVGTGAGCSLVFGAYLPVQGLSPGALVCWSPAAKPDAG